MKKLLKALRAAGDRATRSAPASRLLARPLRRGARERESGRGQLELAFLRSPGKWSCSKWRAKSRPRTCFHTEVCINLNCSLPVLSAVRVGALLPLASVRAFLGIHAPFPRWVARVRKLAERRGSSRHRPEHARHDLRAELCGTRCAHEVWTVLRKWDIRVGSVSRVRLSIHVIGGGPEML